MKRVTRIIASAVIALAVVFVGTRVAGGPNDASARCSRG
jgi:hypothetical protein